MFVCGEAAGLVADQRTIANVAAAAANCVAVLVLETTPIRPMAFARATEAAIIVARIVARTVVVVGSSRTQHAEADTRRNTEGDTTTAGLGLWWSLLDESKRGWHDRWTHTRVVRVGPTSKR